MAEQLEDFVRGNPGFFDSEDKTQEVKKEVYEQAARHLIRDADNDVLLAKRPFETDEYQRYRKDNRRHLTYDPIWQFEKSLIKALQRTHFSIEELPSQLQANLKSKPYTFMDSKVDLDQWVREVLVPFSMLDPNAITVEFPGNPNDPLVPPSRLPENGGVPQDQELDLKTKIYNYSVWRSFKDPDILMLKHPKGYPVLKKGKVEMYDYFFLADAEDWYIYYPSGFDEEGKIVYTLEFWYNHEYGSLPYAPVPGVSVMSIHQFYYRESFVRPFFEYADEFDSRFQDDQVVHTRYAYPREIVSGTKCGTCKGTGRQAYTQPYTGTISDRQCPTCDGSGMDAVASISGRIIRPESTFGKDVKEPVSFVTPDTDILVHTTKNSFFFLEEANKVLGLDSLLPGTESGEAKKIRLQNRIDKLLSYAHSVVKWKEVHLMLKLHIFLEKVAITDEIRIQAPVSISVKSEEALREEVDNSLPIDRYSTIKKYIEEKYSNDPKKQRIHFLALLFAPLLSMRETEIASRIAQGAYTNNDLIRADKAVYIFEILSEDPGFDDPGKTDTFLEAAEKLVEKYLVNQIAEPLVRETRTNLIE